MKSKVRLIHRIVLVSVLFVLLLGLAACQESTSSKYDKANKLLTEGKYTEAAAIFDEISTYEDASKMSLYTKALNAAETGDYDTAFTTFASLGDFKDCSMLITYYKGRQNEASVYDGAWINGSKWFDAIEIYESIPLLRDSKERAESCRKAAYQEAISLMDSGDYTEAYAILINLNEYRDVDHLLETNDNLVAAAAAREAKYAPYRETGSIVAFGTYPQTEAGTDQTPIEWIVLDYDEVNHKALLLSRYGLDAVPYNTEYSDITWEECTLRTWLNGEFMNKSFSAAEQSAILMTQVDNSKSQGYSEWETDGGNNTEDRIFLLSYAEANRYLGVTYNDSNNLKSRVAPTAYALAQRAWISDSNKTEDGAAAGFWWLRSPGRRRSDAADVRTDGSLSRDSVNFDINVVRPAFWLNLESGIF